MAGQGQPAPARRGRAARRVLAGPGQRPRRGAPPAGRNGKRRRRGSKLRPRYRAAARHHRPGHRVLASPSPASDGATRTERYRHDHHADGLARLPRRRPLAAGYAWRWAIETGYRECKTYLRGPGRVLRGRTPDLARQELWAYLAIYQAIRAIIVRAAAGAGLDPDRISFTAALHAARRDPRHAVTGPPALAATQTEILASLVPRREGRICARAVEQALIALPDPGATTTGPISQHASYTVTITTPAPHTHTTTDQPQTSPHSSHDNPP